MGRHYSGDIEGKFWFGVQDSNAADRFGSTGYIPDHLHYFFDRDNLPVIEEELELIKLKYGDYIQTLTDFLAKNEIYTQKSIQTLLKLPAESDVEEVLKDYADCLLGLKIKKCIEEKGYCEFDAEF